MAKKKIVEEIEEDLEETQEEEEADETETEDDGELYNIIDHPDYKGDSKLEVKLVQFNSLLLPCMITQGEKPFYFTDKNDNERKSNKKNWFVRWNHDLLSEDQGGIVKGFKSVNSAIGYAFKIYYKWLTEERKSISEAKKILKEYKIAEKEDSEE